MHQKWPYLLVLWLLTFGASFASQQPNVLIFFVDDMGWADTEINGSVFYESPAQKRLAKEGLAFSQAYAHPLCSPSRAALLSGQYPGLRFNMTRAITGGSVETPSLPKRSNPKQKMHWPTSKNALPLEVNTLAEALKDRGYQTWHLGKWHLMDKAKNAKGGPDQHGFEKWVGVGGAGPGSYFAPYRVQDFPQGPEGEYISERMAQEACHLIEKRDTSKPFFMYYACFNVHGPYQGKKDLIQYYEKKLKSMPESNKQTNPVMAAMLHGMDSELKVLLDKLDELNLSQDTLVVFASDNGGVHWEMGKKKGHQYSMPVTSNHPLRGGKSSWYEGGVRIPMFMRWPNRISPNLKIDTPVHLIDIYPTVLAATETTPQPNQKLDGLNLAPLFKNESLVERPLFCHFPRNITSEDGIPGASFIRLGDYKLVRIYGGHEDGSDQYVLYNLKNDIGETTDLSSQMPEKREQLKEKLNAWLLKGDTLIPQPNPPYKTASK